MTTTDELEAQLRAHPDDVDAHLVYADLLQSRGDAQGELIVIQHQLATQPTAKLKHQQAAWFSSHLRIAKKYELTWRLGFARTLAVRTQKRIDGSLAEIVRKPAFRFLESLTLVGAVTPTVLRTVIAGVPHLRELVVHSPRESMAGSTIHACLQALGTLRRLELFASAFDELPAIVSPMLESLALGQRVGHTIRLVAETPALRTLMVQSPVAPETLEHALNRTWPLTCLGLFWYEAPELLDRLIGSPAWPYLEEVGIDWTRELDDPEERFAPVAPRFGSRRIIPSPFWRSTRLYRFGQALRDSGRFPEALQCFELGVIDDPKDANMWLERGNLLGDLERGPDALESFRRASHVDPEAPAPLYNIAAYHRDANQAALGLESAVNACALDPDDASTWHLRGQLEQMLGKKGTRSLQRAKQLYERAFAADPTDANACFQIGCVHQRLGDRRACLDALARSIELDRDYRGHAREDLDLIPLHADPEFLRLVDNAAPVVSPRASSYERKRRS